MNITNGITPRRWLYACNRPLSNLVSRTLGSESFLVHLSDLDKLKSHANDASLQKEWLAIRLAHKQKLADWVAEKMEIKLNPNSLFDIQVCFHPCFSIHLSIYLSVSIDRFDTMSWEE